MGLKITPREREVLQLISKGYNYREIAENLFISKETVISHRKHLLSKFKVHNSAELIRTAMENNLL
ncbi:MAG: response regulator transcription factor [Bacteroidetes bacterium]|nr:response regulator transcription factor [Bacteroidota bacterium]